MLSFYFLLFILNTISAQKVYEYPAPYGMTPENLMQCYYKKFRRHSPLRDGLFQTRHAPPYLPEDMGEYWLHKQFTESKLRVNHPQNASLFLLNMMPVLSHSIGRCHGKTHDERQILWKNMLENSPYYKNGTPHMFICQSWMCRYRHMTLIPQIRPLLSTMWNLVHEYIWSNRPPNDPKVIIVPYVHNSHISYSESVRNISVFFQGTMNRHGPWRHPLQKIHLEGAKIIDTGVGKKTSHFQEYATLIQSSEFCLIVAGDTPSSRRLFDAIIAGCIPIRVGPSYQLPFEHVIDWNIFLSIEKDDWFQNPNTAIQMIINNQTEKDKSRLRREMRRISPLLNWRKGGGVFDTIIKRFLFKQNQHELSKKKT